MYNTLQHQQGLFSSLPSKAVDKESDGEGAKDATDREDGDGDGPDGREGALGDGLLVAVEPRLIDELLNDLTGEKETNVKYFSSA